MSAENVVTTEVVQYKKRSQGPEVWRRFKKNKRAVFGSILLLLILIMVIFAPVFATHDPSSQEPAERLQTASAEHWFGTDDYGRDIYSRVIYGGRISILIGFMATAFACFFGSILGSIAGYFGGKAETIIMRLMDIFLAIPNLLLAVAISATLGSGIFNTIIAVTITGTPAYCRVMHGAVIALRNMEFIEAAKAGGASSWSIIRRHVISNCIAPIIVQMTLRIGAAIMISASLSFIGLGVAPPTPEWGAMLSAGREYLRMYPHITLYPGIALFLTVFSLNLMGDGFRDSFDPKLKT